jgi:hypothetical protein
VSARRGVGRPAIGGRIDVRLGPELLELLDAEALRLGCTRPELVRQLIAERLLLQDS